MIKKKIKKKDNIINFPNKLSSIEKEIEAIVFAAAEPLDIDTIESKISKKTDVEKILSKLDNIEKSCKNMDNHISFIEIVYESLKTPLRLLSNIRLPFYSITESNSNR